MEVQYVKSTGITISGYRDNVAEAMSEAKDVLREVERGARVKAEALHTTSKVTVNLQVNFTQCQSLINLCTQFSSDPIINLIIY